MLKTLKNAWGIEELRKKILFTLFIILVYRLGNAVPVPYVNTAMLESYFNTVNNTILGLWNTMSGGSFSMATIFALSIQPYINASIIIMTFMAGSALIMWMGEQVTEFGVGNGISIILFASIIARFPSSIGTMITNVSNGSLAWWALALVIVGALAIVVLIVIVNDAERRIPVQYSKRVVGRKLYGGQSTHLPMKVNMSGVMPIIFAQSIASIPATICAFVPSWQNSWLMVNVFNTNTVPYAIIYFLLIIAFSYFYATIQFDPVEIANNLKKNGGFIPGFRAGKPTSEYIRKVLNKITLMGALYLSIVAVVPILIGCFTTATSLSGISLGGTSIIIVVGVALETVRAVEAQMLMRNYKGFLD